ncbi:MAG: hypothetical protein IKB77_03420 [Lentisphaeria bacterium]|nr:hypothetical protein [Lentisphaeria bacterium]
MSGIFSAKCSLSPPAFLRNGKANLSPDCATLGVCLLVAYATHYTPNPSGFYFRILRSKKRKLHKSFWKDWGGSAVAEGYGGTRQGEEFSVFFILLSFDKRK